MCIDYPDLNKVCLKDTYPLSSIDRLIGGVVWHQVLSFLGMYYGYNQTPILASYNESTIFIT